jgi:hypothetical protein
MKNRLSHKIASSALIVAASFGVATSAVVVSVSPVSAAVVPPKPVVEPILTPVVHVPHLSHAENSPAVVRSDPVTRPKLFGILPI